MTWALGQTAPKRAFYREGSRKRHCAEWSVLGRRKPEQGLWEGLVRNEVGKWARAPCKAPHMLESEVQCIHSASIY